MADYSRKSFGMFGGKEQQVKLLVDNSLAGVIIDRFGKDVILIPSDKGHFTVWVEVLVSPQFFGWVFSLGEGIKIISPSEVAEEMRQKLEDMTRKYRNSDKG